MAKTITDLGYTLEQVESPEIVEKGEAQRIKVPQVKDAPKDFAVAYDAARKAGRPIVIDFWATWCGPCIKLKKQTFEDPIVAKALEGVEVIFVDIDKNPEPVSYTHLTLPTIYSV